MTTSIDQTLHQFANLLPNWTLLPILTLLPDFRGFHRTLQRVRLANRGRLLLQTPGPVPFGTCICSNVETILSWTCHVNGPFEFRTSLGTSILPLTPKQAPWHNTRKENFYIITKAIDTITKIKIKIMSRRRIEPTPTRNRCRGWYTSRTSHVYRDPPFYLEATWQLHYKMDYKRSGILTVNGFISTTQRF